jgi:hypothetical protein
LPVALLVWIPGGKETASNQLYRSSFDVRGHCEPRSQ